VKRPYLWGLVAPALVTLALIGCGGTPTSGPGGDKKNTGGDGNAPKFKLAWSEYPSWSVFGVASELGLINGEEGKQGALEKKWGVDIVLELAEYDPCIQLYAGGKCDAVCITNIDFWSAATRKGVAIMPTSTSVGADACLVSFDVADKDKALDELKKDKVYGLAKSVSEYAFDRNLELLKKNPKDYKFTDEPPNTAAAAMQAKKEDHRAIMVWNPFVMQVMKDNPKAKRLFDSSTIPEEIIDMIVVGEDVLKKDKGKEFAYCIADVYYEFNKKMEDDKERDKLLVKLGEKFSKLGLEDMKVCVKETRFYKTPDEGLKLFTGDKLPATMKIVSKFVTDKEIAKKEQVTYAFGPDKAGEDATLRFDPSYMQKVKDQK